MLKKLVVLLGGLALIVATVSAVQFFGNPSSKSPAETSGQPVQASVETEEAEEATTMLMVEEAPALVEPEIDEITFIDFSDAPSANDRSSRGGLGGYSSPVPRAQR
jgi:hypothetical protein